MSKSVPSSAAARAWHAESAEAALQAHQVAAAGLSPTDAAKRLQEHGPNLLPEKGPTPVWLILLRQFASPLIYVLLAAAAVSIFIGKAEDAGFIGAVLAINALIGAFQEYRAEQSSLALRKLLQIRAHVVRQGKTQDIPADEVVPGDIILLESGNRVPADARLINSQALEIDESLLTGESLPVNKDAAWLGTPQTTAADRANMAMAGSMVTKGRGTGVVVATGQHTHVGELALDVHSAAGVKPPLLIRMERFTSYVAAATVACSVVIGILSMALWGSSLTSTFFLVVALAVSAIPEGLPVAMTVALAVASTRMAKRNVIVRRLTAVEGLGSCTLIATDKTGTLTVNELTVREIRLQAGARYLITGQGFSPNGEVQIGGNKVHQQQDEPLAQAVRAVALCNEADLQLQGNHWTWRGDAVDVALLALAVKAGFTLDALRQAYPQVDGIAFESERQFSATFHTFEEASLAFVKGAPERVLEMCDGSLSDEQRVAIEQAALEMASGGLRVIAAAAGRLSQPLLAGTAPEVPQEMQFLGLFGMIDPLRAGAKEAVAACLAAGVQVKMITGDHRVTALAIAKELGLAQADEQVVTAANLEGASEQELAQLVNRVTVFGRVTPRQKLQIVNAARAAGHFVAVTGDGVNDAPALRAANIGVAMGQGGTDVAREAASLVISDDNFSSIVGGIEEGRVAYDNIRKVIGLLIAMGTAELLLVLLSVISGLPVPLLPVQLLWLNLVTDGIQGVALAFEPGEGDSLRKKPRPPGEPIFNRLMVERVVLAAITVGLGGFVLFYFLLKAGWPEDEARNLLLLTMVLFQNFHVGNTRSETKSAFVLSPLRSPLLFFGVLAALGVHIVGMYWPVLHNVLKTQPCSVTSWLVAVLAGVSVVPVIELHKWWWSVRHPEEAPVRGASAPAN